MNENNGLNNESINTNNVVNPVPTNTNPDQTNINTGMNAAPTNTNIVTDPVQTNTNAGVNPVTTNTNAGTPINTNPEVNPTPLFTNTENNTESNFKFHGLNVETSGPNQNNESEGFTVVVNGSNQNNESPNKSPKKSYGLIILAVIIVGIIVVGILSSNVLDNFGKELQKQINEAEKKETDDKDIDTEDTKVPETEEVNYESIEERYKDKSDYNSVSDVYGEWIYEEAGGAYLFKQNSSYELYYDTDHSDNYCKGTIKLRFGALMRQGSTNTEYIKYYDEDGNKLFNIITYPTTCKVDGETTNYENEKGAQEYVITLKDSKLDLLRLSTRDVFELIKK